MNNIPAHNKTYRVVQWAAGRIGQSAMRAVIGHPNLELVGVFVHSEEKAGRDAGELCGLEPIGVKATRSQDDILALKPDCVLYTPEGYNVDILCRLLEAGINVVTTRSEFFYAKLMDAAMRERLDAACRKGLSSLFATGSSPGFSTAVLPMTAVYMSRRVDCLTIDEFADIPASTTPEMITNVMGFGHPKSDEFSQQILDHMSVGFAQSIGAIADGMGLAYDDFKVEGEFALATSPVVLPGGARIEPGTVAGQRITIAAVRNDKPVLQFRVNWYCGKDLDQDWELGDNGWRVVVEGDTPIRMDISFPRSQEQSYADQMSGLTAHPVVNAVAYVCEAAPGIRNNVDLPFILPRQG